MKNVNQLVIGMRGSLCCWIANYQLTLDISASSSNKEDNVLSNAFELITGGKLVEANAITHVESNCFVAYILAENAKRVLLIFRTIEWVLAMN